MNSYLTKLIKSNHTEWKEMNQIKSNQSQEKITQHGFDFYENLMKSFSFYLSTILYFDFDWTYSEMNPVNWHFVTDLEYLTTIPIHYLDLLTNVTKTRITETPSFRIENGCSIWQIHIQSFRSISIITSHVNEQESSSPIFLPYLTVSDITNHTFLLIDSINNIIQSFIDCWIIDIQIGIVWFFAFIDSISFVDKEYGYRFW